MNSTAGGVYCTKFELILKAIPTNRTRGARGGSELNRTLHESPATASLHSATPKRKNVPCSFDFRRGGFFLNGKDIFLFGVLPSKYSGSVARLQFGLGFAKTIFWGYGFSQNRD